MKREDSEEAKRYARKMFEETVGPVDDPEGDGETDLQLAVWMYDWLVEKGVIPQNIMEAEYCEYRFYHEACGWTRKERMEHNDVKAEEYAYEEFGAICPECEEVLPDIEISCLCTVMRPYER